MVLVRSSDALASVALVRQVLEATVEDGAVSEERAVTLTDAATTLGVTAATLRQQIANGKLRATKRGRDWWVTPREVERYRAARRRTA